MSTQYQIKIEFIQTRDLAQYKTFEIMFGMSFEITGVRTQFIIRQIVDPVTYFLRTAKVGLIV